VQIEHAWAGTMSYAVHKMPQIGELGPGVWLAGAFGGHGINTTAMAGLLISAAIRENDDRWRLFSPYELVWAGRRLGQAVAQATFWSMRLRDAAEDAWTRYRHRTRMRVGEKAAGIAQAPAIDEQIMPPVEQHAETLRAEDAPVDAREDAVRRAVQMA